jgi:hypothetical protein
MAVEAPPEWDRLTLASIASERRLGSTWGPCSIVPGHLTCLLDDF